MVHRQLRRMQEQLNRKTSAISTWWISSKKMLFFLRPSRDNGDLTGLHVRGSTFYVMHCTVCGVNCTLFRKLKTEWHFRWTRFQWYSIEPTFWWSVTQHTLSPQKFKSNFFILNVKSLNMCVEVVRTVFHLAANIVVKHIKQYDLPFKEKKENWHCN